MATIMEPTIFELSSPGRLGVKMPASDVPETALPPKKFITRRVAPARARRGGCCPSLHAAQQIQLQRGR